MYKAKLVKMLMVFVAFALILSGCGKTTTTGGNSDVLKLTVWDTQGTDVIVQTEYKDNIVEKWLTEKTGVQVDNIYGNDGGQWDVKLTKLVAGDNLPDIINCGGGQGPAHFAKLDELGEVWHLTPEILQEYAPDLWEQIPQEQWDKMTVNGNILGVPYSYPLAAVTGGYVNFDYSEEDLEYMSQYLMNRTNDLGAYSVWVRDDILKMIYPDAKSFDELVAIMEERQEPIGEELLDIPIYTTEEYVDFMYKVRDLNIKENDKTVYAYGYDGGDNWGGLAMLGPNMCGYPANNYISVWNSATNSVEVPMVHDIIKEAASIQNKMVRDSVIDPESLAHTAEMYKQKVLNGQYALVSVDLMGIDVNQELENAGATFRYRPFTTQVPAKPGYEAKDEVSSISSWGASLALLKSLSEDEMHKVLGWINTQFTDEYLEIKAWGPEEAGLYVENADGTRTFKDDRLNEFFVKRNTGAIDVSETMGLGQGSHLFSINPTASFMTTGGHTSKWSPVVMAKYKELKPASSSGFKFKTDSPHITNVKTAPTFFIWSPAFAEIPGVVDFWGARAQWEDKLKLTFASNDDAQFEERWNDLLNTLNEITDIAAMESEMTKAALEQQ